MISRTTIEKRHHARTYPTCVLPTSRQIVFFTWPVSWERPRGYEPSTQVEKKFYFLPEAWINAPSNSWGVLPTLRPGSKPNTPEKRGHQKTQKGTTRTIWLCPNLSNTSTDTKWKRSHKHNLFPLLSDTYLHPNSVITSVRMLRKCWANWTLLTPHSSYTSQQSETR